MLKSHYSITNLAIAVDMAALLFSREAVDAIISHFWANDHYAEQLEKVYPL